MYSTWLPCINSAFYVFFYPQLFINEIFSKTGAVLHNIRRVYIKAMGGWCIALAG